MKPPACGILGAVLLAWLLPRAADSQIYPPSETLLRRLRLMEAQQDTVFLLFAARQENEFFPFAQDPNFLYLTGLEIAGAVLVLDARRVRSSLFIRRPEPGSEIWQGPQWQPGEEAADKTWMDQVLPLDSLREELDAILSPLPGHSFPSVAILAPPALARDPRHALEASETSTDPLEVAIRERYPHVASFVDAKPSIAGLRVRKSKLEIERIRAACEITSAGLARALGSARAGMWEYQIGAVAEGTYFLLGARRLAFPSIVGSGPNSCILHYMDNRRRTRAGDLVVFDTGAWWEGYCADITRTFPISGRFTARQREIYEAVLEAQTAGIAAARPGATLMEIDRAARTVLDGLDLGKHFLHFTSHYVGLDVHDVGDPHAPLEPGMVITVEPGAYIAEEEIGVRIEDTLVITETGAEVLSDDLPKRSREIERWMSQSVY